MKRLPAGSAEMTGPEMRRLLSLLRGVFVYITDLKNADPMAAAIQYPKIPPRLTESLVIEMIREGAILPHLHAAKFTWGSKLADVVARTDVLEARVEVKGTGASAFQRFYKKDVESDAIVWVHFDRFCSDRNQETVSVYVLEAPRRVLDALPEGASMPITLSEFRRRAGDELRKVEYPLALPPLPAPVDPPVRGAVVADGQGHAAIEQPEEDAS